MIVVVIIGLLAAPWRFLPSRRSAKAPLKKTVINDARKLGAADQQYFMENGVATVACATNATGTVTGPLSVYVTRISKANSLINVNLTTTATITVSNAALQAGSGANPVWVTGGSLLA